MTTFEVVTAHLCCRNTSVGRAKLQHAWENSVAAKQRCRKIRPWNVCTVCTPISTFHNRCAIAHFVADSKQNTPKASIKMSDSKPSANKKYKVDQEGDPPSVYSIIEGAAKLLTGATFCFIVPQSESDRVLTALLTSKNKHYDWSIVEDDLGIELLPKLPTTSGLLVGTLPESLPDGEMETDVLNLILTGGTVFPKKYVFLEVWGVNNYFGSEYSRIIIEIKKPEHMVVYDAARELAEKGIPSYDVELWDETDYVMHFEKTRIDWIESVYYEAPTDRWVNEYFVAHAKKDPNVYDFSDFGSSLVNEDESIA